MVRLLKLYNNGETEGNFNVNGTTTLEGDVTCLSNLSVDSDLTVTGQITNTQVQDLQSKTTYMSDPDYGLDAVVITNLVVKDPDNSSTTLEMICSREELQLKNGMGLAVSGDTSMANVAITGNLTLPLLEDDLVCTITPRTGGNMASAVEINSTGVYGYEFPSNILKEVSFQVQLSHKWKEGSNVVPHFHWCPSTTNTGNAIFNLDYWVVNAGEIITGTTTLTKTTTPSGNAFQHTLTSFGSVAMTGKTASCIFGGRLYRNPTAVGDDFTGTAIILGVDIHVLSDRWGANTDYGT